MDMYVSIFISFLWEFWKLFDRYVLYTLIWYAYSWIWQIDIEFMIWKIFWWILSIWQVYKNAFSTKHEKVTSFAWFINQYKTHFKTYYNNTTTTGWQERHNSSVFEWEWYLRPRILKVLVFFITFYISVYACFSFNVFHLTEAQNLLLIRRMSFRSVIKTKKEYGHRGKESIHSFRKTMHVRDHQPL